MDRIFTIHIRDYDDRNQLRAGVITTDRIQNSIINMMARDEVEGEVIVTEQEPTR